MTHQSHPACPGGGLQQEAAALGVRCITMRERTERPETVGEGTNHRAGTDTARIFELALDILRKVGKQGRQPHLWSMPI